MMCFILTDRLILEWNNYDSHSQQHTSSQREPETKPVVHTTASSTVDTALYFYMCSVYSEEKIHR